MMSSDRAPGGSPVALAGGPNTDSNPPPRAKKSKLSGKKLFRHSVRRVIRALRAIEVFRQNTDARRIWRLRGPLAHLSSASEQFIEEQTNEPEGGARSRTIPPGVRSLPRRNVKFADVQFERVDGHSVCGKTVLKENYKLLLAILHKPGSARTAAELSYVEDVVSATPFFRSIPPSLITDVCRHLRFHRVGKGRTVYRQGDDGSNMYIILSGSIVLEVQRASGFRYHACFLYAGESFGELAISLPDISTAKDDKAAETLRVYKLRGETAIAVEKSELLVVPRIVGEQLQAMRNSVNKKRVFFFRNRVLCPEMFKPLSDQTVYEIAASVIVRKMQRGDVVMEQGVRVSELCFLESGVCRLIKRIRKHPRKQRTPAYSDDDSSSDEDEAEVRPGDTEQDFAFVSVGTLSPGEMFGQVTEPKLHVINDIDDDNDSHKRHSINLNDSPKSKRQSLRNSLHSLNSASSLHTAGSTARRRSSAFHDLQEMIDDAFDQTRKEVRGMSEAGGDDGSNASDSPQLDERWISKHQKTSTEAQAGLPMIAVHSARAMPLSVVADTEVNVFAIPLHVLFSHLENHTELVDIISEHLNQHDVSDEEIRMQLRRNRQWNNYRTTVARQVDLQHRIDKQQRIGALPGGAVQRGGIRLDPLPIEQGRGAQLSVEPVRALPPPSLFDDGPDVYSESGSVPATSAAGVLTGNQAFLVKDKPARIPRYIENRDADLRMLRFATANGVYAKRNTFIFMNSGERFNTVQALKKIRESERLQKRRQHHLNAQALKRLEQDHHQARQRLIDAGLLPPESVSSAWSGRSSMASSVNGDDTLSHTQSVVPGRAHGGRGMTRQGYAASAPALPSIRRHHRHHKHGHQAKGAPRNGSIVQVEPSRQTSQPSEARHVRKATAHLLPPSGVILDDDESDSDSGREEEALGAVLERRRKRRSSRGLQHLRLEDEKLSRSELRPVDTVELLSSGVDTRQRSSQVGRRRRRAESHASTAGRAARRSGIDTDVTWATITSKGVPGRSRFEGSAVGVSRRERVYAELFDWVLERGPHENLAPAAHQYPNAHGKHQIKRQPSQGRALFSPATTKRIQALSFTPVHAALLTPPASGRAAQQAQQAQSAQAHARKNSKVHFTFDSSTPAHAPKTTSPVAARQRLNRMRSVAHHRHARSLLKSLHKVDQRFTITGRYSHVDDHYASNAPKHTADIRRRLNEISSRECPTRIRRIMSAEEDALFAHTAPPVDIGGERRLETSHVQAQAQTEEEEEEAAAVASVASMTSSELASTARPHRTSATAGNATQTLLTGTHKGKALSRTHMSTALKRSRRFRGDRPHNQLVNMSLDHILSDQ